ncbi:MAG: DUF1003 domain-containing protein [Ilumatobacteraceae bacterium]|nr:MAG: DUF1003 domain-containing protein [Actinomycetota bacterium]
MKRREDLTTPRQRRRLGVHYDPNAFGQFSEGIARYLGTARYLVFQTGVIVVWITWNLVVPDSWRFDPWGRGLVLLTLVLSLQASYAAPLILLAQNRQEERDRGQSELDRRVAERTQADTQFLAREIAGVRIALADVVTSEDLKEHLPDSRDGGQGDRLVAEIERLTAAVERLHSRLEEPHRQT